MADVGVAYTLTTPDGTIVFNDGTDPQYYITEIRGLGAPELRTPIDNSPLADGALVHDFWKGPRHIGIEGVILTSTRLTGDAIVVVRNDMETDLEVALESILRADGTLTYTPQGQSARSFTVNYEVPLDFSHGDNYTALTFSFGLVSAEPDWSGSS